MKRRRHHNNKGNRQVKRGRPAEQMKRLAKKMGLPYGDCEKAQDRNFGPWGRDSYFFEG